MHKYDKALMFADICRQGAYEIPEIIPCPAIYDHNIILVFYGKLPDVHVSLQDLQVICRLDIKRANAVLEIYIVSFFISFSSLTPCRSLYWYLL